MRPLLHFLLLGALLHGAARLLPPAADPIVLTPVQVQELRAQWARDTGRAPTAAQEQSSLRQFADDETLLREAFRLGLERSDPVVRSRLLQNLRFADPDAHRGDDETVRQALALGMARADVVVRRRLVQAMEQRIAQSVTLDDAQIDAYVAAHPGRYAAPARYGFRQWYFGADAASADAALATLNAAPDVIVAAEPFLLGTRFAPRPREEIARSFGVGFADVVVSTPPGRWVGPLRSPYGLHLVRIDTVELQAPAGAAVRTQARYALLEEREASAVHERLAVLRARHPLEVQMPVVADSR
jgi:peptidyl-prolyl cis-trans isomerase C